MTVWQQPEVQFQMHSADPVELHPLQLSLRAASKGD